MDLPVDPTTTDANPRAIIQSLPNWAALRRVVHAAPVDIDVDSRDSIDEFIEELNLVQARTLASQIRFAAPRRIFYYRVPELASLQIEDFGGEIDSTRAGAYGPETRAFVHDHDRVYVICSVPPGGTQAQLSLDESSREIVIATFGPGSELLAVRASSVEIADGARSAVLSRFGISRGDRLSPTVLRDQFGAETVAAYTRLTFDGIGRQMVTDWIEVSAGNQADGVEDLRRDDVVMALFHRSDLELTEAQAVLEIGEALSISLLYHESRIDIRRFIPERTLIKLDQAVATAMEQ